MCMKQENNNNWRRKGGEVAPPHELKEGELYLNWNGFKRKEFAVKCEANKEKFFADCKNNGIHSVSLSDFAKQRNLFVCVQRYETRLTNGRYELIALKGWETKPNGLYGLLGLPEIDYDSFCIPQACQLNVQRKDISK